MSTYQETGPTVTTETRILPRELFGDQMRKVTRASDDDARRPRVELYAERLRQGLDLWTGEPNDEALQESVRMQSDRIQATRTGRRAQTNNVVGSV